jgi:hypothetical protein
LFACVFCPAQARAANAPARAAARETDAEREWSCGTSRMIGASCEVRLKPRAPALRRIARREPMTMR